MKERYNQIAEWVKEMRGNDQLYFQDALTIKLNPHSHPLNLWAVCVSPANEIYLMDAEQAWYVLNEKDMNYTLVLNSLYQRVSYLSTQLKKTA